MRRSFETPSEIKFNRKLYFGVLVGCLLFQYLITFFIFYKLNSYCSWSFSTFHNEITFPEAIESYRQSLESIREYNKVNDLFKHFQTNYQVFLELIEKNEAYYEKLCAAGAKNPTYSPATKTVLSTIGYCQSFVLSKGHYANFVYAQDVGNWVFCRNYIELCIQCCQNLELCFALFPVKP